MPLIRSTSLQNIGKFGIWSLAEPESYFRTRFSLPEHEQREFDRFTGSGRRLEWLCTRWLLHTISGEEERLQWSKDVYGKPYIQKANMHISISHSHALSAAFLSAHEVGIDIQKQVDKITRLRYKFVSPEENKWIEEDRLTDYLHVIWGAKEVMYKIYGRKRLEYITNLEVDPIAMGSGKVAFTGRILKDDVRIECDLYFENLEPYYLVYGVKNDSNT